MTPCMYLKLHNKLLGGKKSSHRTLLYMTHCSKQPVAKTYNVSSTLYRTYRCAVGSVARSPYSLQLILRLPLWALVRVCYRCAESTWAGAITRKDKQHTTCVLLYCGELGDNQGVSLRKKSSPHKQLHSQSKPKKPQPATYKICKRL
ncbi:hypothetical protein AMECASPLE_015830 [Ameca splendens]|uniref:Uncharacterized protein n=1 Tax=Ameca splendens TaxID=208324 RepID=A0ABV0ZZ21_9TELE